MTSTITFHGAAQTVTGSRHLLEVNRKRILIDCGLFQGDRELRNLNWQEFPVEPHRIDAIVLTHAHTDHVGYLPRLVAQGFRGPVFATAATLGIARISLPDSGRLQEEEARYLNRKRLSRHQPALPLYTEKDAYEALRLFKKTPYHQNIDLPGGCTLRFAPAGHILGSAFAEIFLPSGDRLLMSGDLGRKGTPVIKDPTPVEYAEQLVIESTYGDRLHSTEDPLDALERVFKRAFAEGGAVIVPSFAIGRTQDLLYYIHQLNDQNRVPRVPVYLDSPMAVSTTQLYRSALEEHDAEMQAELNHGHQPLEPEMVFFVRDRNESKALNARRGPLIIIAGSGMVNGGRIVHHLKNRISDPSTTVLFTGYQANGTTGREILDGAEEVRLLGENVPVRAQVERMQSLSAHADQQEMMEWLGHFKAPPQRTFLVHGEPPAQEALRNRITHELGWNVVIPELHESFKL